MTNACQLYTDDFYVRATILAERFAKIVARAFLSRN
jgi:hypothetical protein